MVGVVASYAVYGSASSGAVPKLLFAFGCGGVGDGQFKNGVHSVAVAPDGTIWCGDGRGCQLFSSNGKFVCHAAPDQLRDCCTGIAIDSNCEVFCLDFFAATAVVCRMDGSFIRSFGSFNLDYGIKRPAGLAVDGKGLLFVVDGIGSGHDRVLVLRRDGSFVMSIKRIDSDGSGFPVANGIALSAAGELFLPDSYNNIVQVLCMLFLCVMSLLRQVFDVHGKFVRAFGSGGSSHGRQLCRPHGISLDRAGHVLVGDCDNCRVQIFEQDGTFVTIFGSQGRAAGQFEVVNYVHVGCNDGAIYVADSGNMRVQVFGFAHWYCVFVTLLILKFFLSDGSTSACVVL